jgi:hypothetical protein
VVGEVGHASGSFSEVGGGALGPAHEDGWRVRWLGTGGATRTKARRGRGGLPEGGSSGGADKMNGRVLFYRCVGGGWMGWMG